MPYDNTPGVRGSYLDGSLRIPTSTSQPEILVLAPGTSGLTYEKYTVRNSRAAEVEFGGTTELVKGMHEVLAQGADNVSLMRIGGTQGSLTLTDNLGGTLVATPESRDDDVLGRYALHLEVNSGVQRVVVYDLVDEGFVYDSSEILVLDEGVITVVNTNFDLFAITGSDLTDTTTLIAMDTLIAGDFAPDALATAATVTVTATEGTDGTANSLVEKYAALNTAYHLLDYRDADFVVPQGVYIDDANVTDTGAVANYFFGMPTPDSQTDELGYLWQYIYRGKLYTYFVDSDSYFTDEATAAASTVTLASNSDITLTAQKTGVGGDNISITVLDTPPATALALANALKATLNAHYADAVEHPTAADGDNTILSPDATNTATLITLVTEMLTSYDAHEGDAEQVAGWSYHGAQESGDASLASTAAPTNVGECITRLNDLKTKYNTHDADAVPHNVGSAHQEATADAVAGATTYTITEPSEAVSLLIVVDLNGSGDTEGTVVTNLNLALAAETLSNGVLANTLVLASGAGVGGAVAEANTSLASGAGGHVLTHAQLTGDTVPAAVTTAFAAGTDSQLRECNFAHQLASFCEHASVVWKAMQGAISTKGPTGRGRQTVSDWVGSAPVYTVGPDGIQDIIDASTDNGTGLLGIKLMSGFASPSATGYRNHMIVDVASARDGYAYGGLIKTVGASLPNANDFPDRSYGILDTDEATDANGEPVDIGKFIYVTYDWPILRNSYNGGTSYIGSIANTFVAKLAIMPENEEPIGQNGKIIKVVSPPRVHATQVDQLAKLRMIGLRNEEGVGYIFVTARTAAHPTSDYVRASTMRCVNRELRGIRNIAKPYIGKDFSAQRLVALQSAIDRFLQAEGAAGFNQGARATINFTRADKIMGRLTVNLRMVPPFSIESIDVSMSLAADESEL